MPALAPTTEKVVSADDYSMDLYRSDRHIALGFGKRSPSGGSYTRHLEWLSVHDARALWEALGPQVEALEAELAAKEAA